MTTLAEPQPRTQALDVRDFLGGLGDEDLLHVSQEVDPARFEVTAVLQRLEDLNRYPAVLFDNPLALDGQPAGMPILTNVFATRARCAAALGLPKQAAGTELSLEYARREARRLSPVVIEPTEAPVKEVAQTG